MSIHADHYALRDFTGLAQALSDPNRVRALIAMRDNELCVCQLVELLGLASSSVSRHLAILARAYLVDSRKDGRWVYYRRAGESAPLPVREALKWIDTSLPEDPDDRARLEEILSCPVEDLCRTSSPED
jgi:DNA-binding transcriptional ArsR family regulator